MASTSNVLIVPPTPPAMTNTVAAEEGLRDIRPPVYIFDKWGWVIAGASTPRHRPECASEPTSR